VKSSKEISQEIRRIRERAKSLSGFWISEFAAGISSLEWALGKRERAPSEDIGSAASGQGEIAKRLLDALSKAGKPAKTPKKR
jgi:ribosomal protein S19E (S16A)